MKTLQEIEQEVARLARRVGASLLDMPAYGVPQDFGCPHVEVKNGLYHYVVVERGEEIERRSSADFDDLVYWIFSSVTHRMAFLDIARIKDQDCRRVAFPQQIMLMKRLGPKMGERMARDIADILRRAPYDDEPTKALDQMRRT